MPACLDTQSSIVVCNILMCSKENVETLHVHQNKPRPGQKKKKNTYDNNPSREKLPLPWSGYPSPPTPTCVAPQTRTKNLTRSQNATTGTKAKAKSASTKERAGERGQEREPEGGDTQMGQSQLCLHSFPSAGPLPLVGASNPVGACNSSTRQRKQNGHQTCYLDTKDRSGVRPVPFNVRTGPTDTFGGQRQTTHKGVFTFLELKACKKRYAVREQREGANTQSSSLRLFHIDSALT